MAKGKWYYLEMTVSKSGKLKMTCNGRRVKVKEKSFSLWYKGPRVQIKRRNKRSVDLLLKSVREKSK